MNAVEFDKFLFGAYEEFCAVAGTCLANSLEDLRQGLMDAYKKWNKDAIHYADLANRIAEWIRE